MSSLGSPNPFFIAGKKAYEVERSLRFNRDDDAYLQATLGNSNLNKWTLSIWVKKPVNGEHQAILASGDSSVSTMVNFGNSDRLKFTNYPGSSAGIYITTRKFRDPSAWYHIVAIWDSGNSTAGDRIRLYVNGVRETAFDQSDNPNQNQNSVINGNTQGGSTWGEGKHRIGRYSNYADNSGCYYAEVNFIDGQAYDPSYFAETNPVTGQWNPKKYTGSYGTNGFYLNFADNSGTTATTLGKDSSGNGNNFTLNNFGTGDAVKDTPTNNFCTLNSIYDAGAVYGSGTLSESGLRYTGGSSNRSIGSTFGIRHTDTQGYYFEARIISGNTANRLFVGIGYTSTNWITTDARGANDDSWVLRNGDGVFIHNSSSDGETTGAGALSVGDIIQIAVKGSKIWVGKNGSYFFSGNPSGDSTPKFSDIASTWTPVADVMTSNVVQFNFGQDSSFSNTVTAQGNADANGNGDFYYSPPTGFLALCSANLPDSTILQPNKHFDTLLYTGNSSTQSITGLNFQPDWVWIKKRDSGGSTNHNLFDSVRGVTKYLQANVTNAESTDTDSLTAFNSDGFSLGNYNLGNLNAKSIVAWNWNVGDTDSKTYTVTVVDDSGNKYRFDGFGTSAVTLDLAEGGTYIFNYPSAHPFRFSETSDGTHGGGSEYTTGVTVISSTSIQIVVAASAPTLYYYCSSHSGMGGAINTNTTLGSSNFDGSVQSIVKVNATAGMSITRYTGTGGNITVGHGLGVTPQVTMTKSLTATSNWSFLHTVYDGSYDLLYLNSSATYSNSSITAPTSTVFSRTSTDANNEGMICYSFAEVAGYSKFGFYTGTGNDNGTYVFCGFRPAWIMIKGRTGTRNWFIVDTKRDTFNLTENALLPNTNGAETTSTSYNLDILSNGFKLRKNNTQSNQSNIVYIFMAFAESPFKNARAR